VGALVIKGGEIGYQLRFSFAKTILLLHVSTPTKKYKRALKIFADKRTGIYKTICANPDNLICVLKKVWCYVCGRFTGY
jgi:hypothetical protein